MVVHLLGQLPGQLDRLHIRAKSPAENPLEKGLDLVFECAEDHVPGDTRQSMLTNGYYETGGPHGHHERRCGDTRNDQQCSGEEYGTQPGNSPEPMRARVR